MLSFIEKNEMNFPEANRWCGIRWCVEKEYLLLRIPSHFGMGSSKSDIVLHGLLLIAPPNLTR
jgi:hypothetical protein